MESTYETNLVYRKRDENGDMVYGHGQDDYLSGIEAMAGVIKSRLEAGTEKWWEGDETALNYFDDILTAYQTEENRSMIDLMIIERIMDTRGVISVTDVESYIENRQYVFSCNANTVYGITPVEVTI